SYDDFANITQLVTYGTTRSTPVNASTNRMTAASYDAAGNLTDIVLDGETFKYTYDAVNMMKYLQSSNGTARVFLYNADDQRVVTFDCPLDSCGLHTAEENWTLRGFNDKVLRAYSRSSDGKWNWPRDYTYRHGQLLAAVENTGAAEERKLHFHTDHLGTPRQITNESKAQIAAHDYYPFGKEATDPSQDHITLKFTGHEKDLMKYGPNDLDYMLARYCSTTLGRFLSVDPILGKLRRPQTWNRYAYVVNSPITFLDPDGRIFSVFNAMRKIVRALKRRFEEGDDTELIEILNTAQGRIEDLHAGTCHNKVCGVVQKTLGIDPDNPMREMHLAALEAVLGGKSGSAKRFGSEFTRQSQQQLLKSKRSYERLIAQHRRKLTDYKENPFAFDNRGTLRNTQEHLRPRIIEARIKELERQIGKQERALQIILELLNG
ncbi:MAG: hypothetical protein GY847_06880, partial [Proteobacteria bacterium]|nr:hypothetical protein [Pseudomonadota bacterium]